MSKLDWTDLDQRAVDTARVLAMDAVQKVGNGHPGTAMSLAPVAYTLFQKAMRHNPADPDWVGRDRFVLSAGHSSITLYTQLYLAGFGLELDDLKSLRTWGSKTPGHPEHGHTAGVETTTGPLGQGVGNAVGMAMAARRERGLFDPEAAPGESPFDHHVYAICSDGDLEEGVSAEASSHRRHPAARQPHPDLRRQRHLDRGRHRHRVHRGRRRALRGLRLGRAPHRLDQRRHPLRGERPGALGRAREGPAGHRPAELHRPHARSSPGRPRTRRAPASRTARPSARRRSRPPRRSSASTRDQTFEVPPEVIEHTRKALERGKAGRGRVAGVLRRLGQALPAAQGALRPDAHPQPARRLGEGAAVLPRRREGRRDPQGLRRGALRDRPRAARAVGRLGRPGRVQQHHPQGPAVVHPRGAVHQGLLRRRVRPGAALRHPRARHGLGDERHRAARRHPCVRRHVPRRSPTTCAARSGSRR